MEGDLFKLVEGDFLPTQNCTRGFMNPKKEDVCSVKSPAALPHHRSLPNFGGCPTLPVGIETIRKKQNMFYSSIEKHRLLIFSIGVP